MAVQWALGLPQGNALTGFMQGMELGRQHRRENALMQMQEEELGERRRLRQARRDVGGRVATGDYSGARTAAAQAGDFDLIQAINNMTAEQRAQVAAQSQVLAPVYRRLRELPYEARRPELQRLAPRLQAQGVPADVIANYDPTDQALDSDIELSRRVGEPFTLEPGAVRYDEFNNIVARGPAPPPNYIPVPPGGRLVLEPGTGGSGVPAEVDPGQGEVTATNPQTGERVRLNPQTGQWEPVQGGASPSNGSRSFP